MLVYHQGPLCQIFIKIQVRDPEILDPKKRKNCENDLHVLGPSALNIR